MFFHSKQIFYLGRVDAGSKFAPANNLQSALKMTVLFGDGELMEDYLEIVH